MSRSAERMGMPALDEESALEGLKAPGAVAISITE